MQAVLSGLGGNRGIGRRGDGEAHGAHQTHVVDLFAGVDFHFIAAGFPPAFRGEQCEITGLVFQGDVHRVFRHDRLPSRPCFRLGVATPEYLKRLIVLVKLEDNEDRFRTGEELFGWSDRDDFVGPLKAQFFIESLGEDNAAEHALGRGVKIVGFCVLGAILKVRDRHIVREGELLGSERRG